MKKVLIIVVIVLALITAIIYFKITISDNITSRIHPDSPLGQFNTCVSDCIPLVDPGPGLTAEEACEMECKFDNTTEMIKANEDWLICQQNCISEYGYELPNPNHSSKIELCTAEC
jgi:hypothetical protein